MSSFSFDSIVDFLEPVNKYELSNDEGYKDIQLGGHIEAYEEYFPDIERTDIVLVGCNEYRGEGVPNVKQNAANIIRSNFYNLFHWHHEVSVADAGNVKTGATLQDTYAALRTVVTELTEQGKRVVILCGSHDLTVAQYGVYSRKQQIIEATCVDAAIDLNIAGQLPSETFLFQLLTGEPNFLKHYNHIGFQSYLVHPAMLETIDKLRFDCFRVGKVKENIEDMEPVIRNSSLFSFDISAIQHSHAPCNTLTPNGFNGEEACTLMQYAGMSPNINTYGIYGYRPDKDVHDLTAKQISHMLWYLMDGIYKGKQEAGLEQRSDFNEFNLAFAEVQTIFLQSKKTGRWWVQLPDGKFIACSHHDYMIAANNDIPERWLRAVERM